MKLALLATIALSISAPALSVDTYVQGHVRRDGTYVQPHYQTASDNTRSNNYSTQGNTNPYTGQQGYADPYKSAPNPYANPYDSRRKQHQ